MSHDLDGDWQFFAADDTNESKNAMLIAAEEILSIDPTLRDIAAMPPGYVATRKKSGDKWTITPHALEEEK